MELSDQVANSSLCYTVWSWSPLQAAASLSTAGDGDVAEPAAEGDAGGELGEPADMVNRYNNQWFSVDR